MKTIQKFRMIERGETLLAAVSGGCDSCVLLHLLLGLVPSWNLKLAIAHVNHELRGQASNQDEEFVRALAKKYKIPFFTAKVSVKTRAREQKMSLEEAARCARYEFFEQTLKTKGAGKLVLAHTLDDQAETVLMRLLNGTGLQGLQAIRPKRKLNGAYLVRPLIEISRAEIRSYAKENKIKFREDQSNRSLKFVRNKIRLELIPFLEQKFNPQVKKALARLPHLLDVDLSFLDETADFFYRQLAVRENGQISFPKQSFRELKPSIQYRLLNRALHQLAHTVEAKASNAVSEKISKSSRAVFEAKASNAELDFEHWNQFFGLFMTERNFKYQLPKGFIAVVSKDDLKIRHAKRTPISFSYSLKLNHQVYISELNVTVMAEKIPPLTQPSPPGKGRGLGEGGNKNGFKKTDKSFEILDGNTLSFPLTIRSRQAGDRLQPLGQQKKGKLKSLLINKQIPLEQRDRLPIVLSGNQIVWVGGVTMGEPFKVTPKTSQFIRLSLKPGN